MLKKITLLFFALTFFFSCKKQEPIDGFTRDDSGYYYQLLSIGDGNNCPLKENVVILDAVMKTLSDSVFWDSRKDAANGFYVSLNVTPIESSCRDYLLKMVEGDSVVFLVKPTVFFKDFFSTKVPEFCKKDSLIKLYIKLNQIISVAEYETLKKGADGRYDEKDEELEELQIIDAYLSKKYPLVKADENGLYILQKTEEKSQKVSFGKKITLTYRGTFLDGKPVDNSDQIIEFIYGTPDQLIKGLNIAIGLLKKGETTKIIVPSRLAFGELGSSNGFIPPYTPLVYNIKIIDIKNK